MVARFNKNKWKRVFNVGDEILLQRDGTGAQFVGRRLRRQLLALRFGRQNSRRMEKAELTLLPEYITQI